MRLPSIKQLPWLIISFFLGLVVIMMVVAETPQQEEEGLFSHLDILHQVLIEAVMRLVSFFHACLFWDGAS